MSKTSKRKKAAPKPSRREEHIATMTRSYATHMNSSSIRRDLSVAQARLSATDSEIEELISRLQSSRRIRKNLQAEIQGYLNALATRL